MKFKEDAVKKLSAIILMLLVGTNSAAQKSGSAEDIKSKEAEVAHLSSLDLGFEYVKILQAQRERQKNSGKMFEANSDDVWRSVAILNQLEKRKKEGDKEALYQHARINANLCEKLVSVKREYGEKTCREVEIDLRSLANEDNRAMSILAVMYEEGIWFEKSMFAASDWYLKLAEFYEKIGRREEMLTNIEKSLKLNSNSRRAKEFANRVM